MKQFYLIFLVWFSSFFSASGQRKEPYTFLKTGQVTLDDLKMRHYANDTSAGAVILYDAGRTKFNSNFTHGITISHERHVVIKIFRKSGYDAANVEIPLFLGELNRETISSLTGASYNLVNGKIEKTTLGKDAIFEEKSNPLYNLHKFAMPNVKEGSVLEYTYRVFSPFISVYQPWNFQYKFPVAWSDYRAEIPDNFMYKTMFQGLEPITFTEEKNTPMTLVYAGETRSLTGKETRWVMTNVPALHEEPFISTIRNYQSRVEFELTNINTSLFVEEQRNNTWDKISTNLLKSNNFGFYFSRTAFTKEQLTSILSGIIEPEKKIAAIHKFIQNAALSDNSKGIIPRQPLRKVLETKKGTPAEMNLLMLCFLREAGLTADPVLLSTRENGLVTQFTYPNIQKFNYLIVRAKAGEKEYLLDASEPFAPAFILPEKCLNGDGLVLATTQPEWVNLRANGKANHTYYTKVNFENDLSMKGKMQVASNGYAALTQRQEMAKAGEKKFFDDFSSKNTSWELTHFNLVPVKELSDPVKFDINFTVPAQSSSANTIYLQPIMHPAFQQNPLKADTRLYPVDFTYPKEETLIYNYTLPEGYRVDEQPKDAIISLPENGGKFSYSVTTMGNTINVISKLSVDRAVFAPEEYPYLKEFFNQVLAKQAEQIVLKKTSATGSGQAKPVRN